MEDIKVGCNSIKSAMKIENKDLKVKEFLKKNKILLIITAIFVSLISVYTMLIINFINLIKILN